MDRSRGLPLLIARSFITVLLCLLGACGNDEPRVEKAAAVRTQAKQRTYAECMAAADRQPSRAETVAKARECIPLPTAPLANSTVPPSVPTTAGGTGAAEPLRAADSLGAIRSVYTSLAEADCRVIEVDKESGSSVSRCSGVAGYALKVLDGDARMSVDVITPDGRDHSLNYLSVITRAFSSLGPRAEWRMQSERPVALIVRVNAYQDPENPDRTTSYLAVARITPAGTCVTDRIGPVPNANAAARAAADRAAVRPCLGEVP
ncbi:MAG: hypothetical protein KY467_17840 [Gemmatimonadetes bacterium]|nr:hypothetical protein [Gemmatimonadota bacterium]